MSGYCLDTSAYSQFRRGHSELVALVDRAAWIGVPTVTMGELRTGFLLGNRRERNESELDQFLANPAVEVLGVDAEASRHYAEIVADLRTAGTPLPTNDIWIAATAARHGAAVLTCDDHFEQIARVGAVVFDPDQCRAGTTSR
jgi:tRNA(fMet)-specific endonuclease VapC